MDPISLRKDDDVTTNHPEPARAQAGEGLTTRRSEHCALTKKEKQMMRSLIVVMAGLLLATQSKSPGSPARPSFAVVESSIREMQAAMAEGRTTAREIVQQYLIRIA